MNYIVRPELAVYFRNAQTWQSQGLCFTSEVPGGLTLDAKEYLPFIKQSDLFGSSGECSADMDMPVGLCEHRTGMGVPFGLLPVAT